MCERTEELAEFFDNEQQSMLIWTSVFLTVENGVNAKKVMHRDVLGILSKYAPPGTYSSIDLQSDPVNDSVGTVKKSDKGPVFLVSEEQGLVSRLIC